MVVRLEMVSATQRMEQKPLNKTLFGHSPGGGMGRGGNPGKWFGSARFQSSYRIIRVSGGERQLSK